MGTIDAGRRREPFRGLLREAYEADDLEPDEPTLADALLGSAAPTLNLRPRTTPPPLPRRNSLADRQRRARHIFKGALEKRKAGSIADAHLDALLAAAIDPDNETYKAAAARWALPAPAPRLRRSAIRKAGRLADRPH